MAKEQSHLLPTVHYPWIVFPYEENKNQIFCSLSHPHKIFQKSIPELDGVTKIMARCFDWLLLSRGDTNTDYSLWNPTNSNSIKLPPLKLKYISEIISCAITSPPGGRDPKKCMVLMLDKVQNSIILIRPDAQDKRWIKLHYEKWLLDNDDDFLESCLSCNGKVYAMTFLHSKLVTLNVDKYDHLVIQILPCSKPDSKTYSIRVRKFMTDLGGEMFVVRIFYGETLVGIDEVLDVHVFKLDLDNMAWSRVKDLMGATFFYDGNHAFSCAATTRNEVESDSIYFTMPHDMECFYCFNLKEGHLQVNLPCPILSPSSNYPMFLMLTSNVRLSSNNINQVENDPSKGNQVADCSVKILQKEDSMKGTRVAKTKFQDLPSHVLKLIADSLNLFDYILNFRVVSRDFSLAAPPLRRIQAIEKLKASPLCPWLFFPTSLTVLNCLDPKHSYRFLVTIPETLGESQLRCTKHGWMMMSDCESSLTFYRPFTKAKVGLVIPDEIAKGFLSSYVMGFSHLPTCPTYVVIGFNDSFINGITANLAVVGQGQVEWYTFRLECDFLIGQSYPIFFDGAFHVLGLEGNLLVFRCNWEENIRQENVNWYILDKVPCESAHQSYILEWDGKIASVFVGLMGKWVRVFKLSSTTFNWESVESLGDHTFFVSRLSCHAIDGRSLGMENRIYFPRVHGNKVLYYSMESRKFHFDRDDYLDDFHNTKEQLRGCWFDPRHI